MCLYCGSQLFFFQISLWQAFYIFTKTLIFVSLAYTYDPFRNGFIIVSMYQYLRRKSNIVQNGAGVGAVLFTLIPLFVSKIVKN